MLTIQQDNMNYNFEIYVKLLPFLIFVVAALVNLGKEK